MQTVTGVLTALTALPPLLLYLILAGGAAVENVAPPVPADTFVLAGALLAAEGAADPWAVFFATWVSNVLTAVAVYGLARKYGLRFFKMPIARWLLREHQLEQIGGFYETWGIPAIFLSRFLPGWRAMVPVFAGVTRVTAWKVVPPMAVASALWYGLLVYLGVFVARSLETVVRWFGNVNDILLWVALVLAAGIGIWWWRSRHHDDAA